MPAVPSTLPNAVPPSDGLTLPTSAGMPIAVTAHHRLDGRCQSMWVVDAVPGPAFGIWLLAPWWQNTVAPATSLTQQRGMWHGELSWTAKASAPAHVGIVLCIVPPSLGIWRLSETLAAAVAKTAIAGPPLPPDLRAIEAAFILQSREPGTFGAAVIRP